MSHFTVQAATLKKIKIHVETLHSTKMKEEKASKGGKKGGKARSTVKMDLQKVSYIIIKSTNNSGLKGQTGMLPWLAIPFLKGLGMLTPNPCQNG